MPGKRATDAIFTVRQMQEKCGFKGKKLYFMASGIKIYSVFQISEIIISDI